MAEFGFEVDDGLLSVSLGVFGSAYGSLGGFDRSLLSINTSLKSSDGCGQGVCVSGDGVDLCGKVGGIRLHFFALFAQFIRSLS